ncbi:MAG: SIMPL domain-containing protein [Ginsengibacter sp.]
MKKISLPLMAFIIICLSTNAQNRVVQNPYPKTINVTGSAEMEVIPDEIYVQVDLREYKKKGNEKVALESIRTGFLSACRAAGIPDSMIGIASYAGTNYNNGFWRRKKDPDLLAGISYQVQFSDSKKMDDLVERLDDDATTNFQIVKVSHSKIEQFKRQLKTEAIKKAREKALYLTGAISEELGEAVTINDPIEEGNYNVLLNNVSNFSLKEMKRPDMEGSDQNAAIDFKKIKLKYEIGVVFALK